MLFASTSRNPASRFLREIPEEVCDIKGNVFSSKPVSRSSIFSDTSGFSGNYLYKKSAGKTLYGATVSKNESNITYTPGQRVLHKTFGEGMIISAKPMGGDTMLEVAFDNVGTKKLMAAYAKLTVM